MGALPGTDESLICSYDHTGAMLSGWMEEHRLLACTLQPKQAPAGLLLYSVALLKLPPQIIIVAA